MTSPRSQESVSESPGMKPVNVPLTPETASALPNHSRTAALNMKRDTMQPVKPTLQSLTAQECFHSVTGTPKEDN